MTQYKGFALDYQTRGLHLKVQYRYRLYKIANCFHMDNEWVPAADIKYMIDEALKGNTMYAWILICKK